MRMRGSEREGGKRERERKRGGPGYYLQPAEGVGHLGHSPRRERVIRGQLRRVRGAGHTCSREQRGIHRDQKMEIKNDSTPAPFLLPRTSIRARTRDQSSVVLDTWKVFFSLIPLTMWVIVVLCTHTVPSIPYENAEVDHISDTLMEMCFADGEKYYCGV